MKKSIEERLQEKTGSEINAIAKRMKYPLRGTKQERIHSLVAHFNFSKEWKDIVG